MSDRNPIPLSLDKPMQFAQPLDFTDARDALRECAQQRHQARDWKQRSMHAAADKEHTYRKARAVAWTLAPEGTAKMREDWVNDHTADARRERDWALYLIKAADERLAEVDGERASLHRLIDASMPAIQSGMQEQPPTVRRAA